MQWSLQVKVHVAKAEVHTPHSISGEMLSNFLVERIHLKKKKKE